MQNGITTLADVLSAAAELPSVRIGIIASVNSDGTVQLRVEGTTDTRRARWLGNNSRPVVGQRVTYLNESPIPTVMGRVANNSEDQNFGAGTVTGGALVDSVGNVRTGINTASSAAASAASQAVTGISNASAAQAAANAAQNTANNAQTTANTANNTANNAQSRINTLQSQVNGIQTQLNNLSSYAVSLENTIINQQGQINGLQTQITNNLNYARSLENTLIAFLGPGGPDD